MRLVVISDTHLRHAFKVPDGDVLVHCGDFTMRGEAREIIAFDTWLDTLPHKYKVVIAGNHEIGFEESPKAAQMLLKTPIYLQDSSIIIEGVKFYGSPWQPWFFSWAFNMPQGEAGRAFARAKWAQIPDDVDILITHGPPYGILDTVLGRNPREHLGCRDLIQRTKDLKNLKLHAFGHIHSGHGVMKRGDLWFANASICDESYYPTLPPLVFDLVNGVVTPVKHP